MKAVRLRTNYLNNPVGIDIRKPSFSWNCEGGKHQSAYRIVCENFYKETVWDSGKVFSSQMTRVEYAGEKLSSRDRISWYVILWDENDAEGEKSEAASFEMGLLEQSDWKAKWISGAYTVNKKKRYPIDCFIKVFEVRNADKVIKARAYMTACGVYEGTLNRCRIGDFFLAPGITDYRKRIQYQTVDITDMIHEGKNELEFLLADGWYRGSVGAWAIKNFYGSQTKLLVQLEITYEDGHTEYVLSDESFKWHNETPIRFADNKDGEIYDASYEEKQPNAANAIVSKCSVIPSASNNVNLIERERITSPKLIITPSGRKVLDFGQNIAGIIEFHIKEAHSGEKLFLRFGEKLGPDGEFTQHNIQCVRGKLVTPLQQIDYTCKEGSNDYKTRFAIFGYQLVEVGGTLADALGEGENYRIHPEDFIAIAVSSNLEETIKFDSSNELLNRFVKNTLWSLRNNHGDLPTDCPTRERHGWTGDAQLFCKTASMMTSYAPFAKKFLNDLRDWQRPNGRLPQIAPEGGTDFYMRPMNGSTGWADAGVIIPYTLWKQYGDFEIIEEYYDMMQKYAHYMIGRAGKRAVMISEKANVAKCHRKYLYNVGQHYGEWAEPIDVHSMGWKDFMTSNVETSTAYLFYVMSLMVEVTKEMLKDKKSNELEENLKLFAEYRDGSKKAYQALVSTQEHTLDTNRQAKLVRPLYFKLLNEEQTDYAKKRLIKALDEYKWRVGTGFLSTPFILYVLQDIDIELAYKLLENEEKPGWLFMVKAGATSIWEDWDGPTCDNGKGGGIASLNHYSKGAICEWIFSEMCGIHVEGERHFRIEPHPGGSFDHASTEYDSVYGKVTCGWRKLSDGHYRVEVSIPANTTATLCLPEHPQMTLGDGDSGSLCTIMEW